MLNVSDANDRKAAQLQAIIYFRDTMGEAKTGSIFRIQHHLDHSSRRFDVSVTTILAPNAKSCTFDNQQDNSISTVNESNQHSGLVSCHDLSFWLRRSESVSRHGRLPFWEYDTVPQRYSIHRRSNISHNASHSSSI